MQLKVMSWNIWHGKYLDQIIRDIKKINPDIIGLQEVIQSPKIENIAKQIADNLSYEFAYCKAFLTDRHTPSYEQGNAILSKYKLVKSECYFLSDPKFYKKDTETEPRVAIKTEVQINNKLLSVVTTQLAHTHNFEDSEIRQLQVKNLLKLVPSRGAVLMGDFNSLPDKDEVKKVTQTLKDADSFSNPTWCVYPKESECGRRGLKYRIDYIFVGKDIEVKEFKIGDSKASDHLPIFALLKV